MSIKHICAGAALGRKSKRARKGRAPLRVDSGDTLRQLKMKILETLGLHPDNADVGVLTRTPVLMSAILLWHSVIGKYARGAW